MAIRPRSVDVIFKKRYRGRRVAPRPPSKLRQGAQMGAAMVDQVLSSGTQLLLIMLLAHISTAEEFGAASIALIIQGLTMGSHRALLGDVVVLRCRSRQGRHDDEIRTALTMSIAVSLLLAMVLAVAALVMEGQIGALLLPVSLVIPFTLLQDLLRSFAYGRRDVVQALKLDALWLVVMAGGSGLLLASDRATATMLIVVWGAGALVSLLYGLAVVPWRSGRARVRRWLEEDGTRAWSFGADYLVNSGFANISVLALSWLIPLGELGWLRLAKLSMAPAGNVIAGVRSLILGSLAETSDDPGGVRRLRNRASIGLFGLASIYGLTISVMPVSFGERVFGSEWGQARALVIAVALSETLRLSLIPPMDVVRIFGTPRQLLGARATMSFGVVSAVLVGGGLWGATGVVWGEVVVMVLVSGGWWWLSSALTGSEGRGRTAIARRRGGRDPVGAG